MKFEEMKRHIENFIAETDPNQQQCILNRMAAEAFKEETKRSLPELASYLKATLKEEPTGKNDFLLGTYGPGELEDGSVVGPFDLNPWMVRSAEKGFLLAQAAQGEFHTLQENYEEAKHYLDPLVEVNIAVALDIRAHMYQFGHGEPGGKPNYDRAIELYQKVLTLPYEDGHLRYKDNINTAISECRTSKFKDEVTQSRSIRRATEEEYNPQGPTQ